MKVAFYTLGCKVNQYETEAMREAFAAAGHTPVTDDAPFDAVVINRRKRPQNKASCAAFQKGKTGRYHNTYRLYGAGVFGRGAGAERGGRCCREYRC